jgi:hypothetical protein
MMQYCFANETASELWTDYEGGYTSRSKVPQLALPLQLFTNYDHKNMPQSQSASTEQERATHIHL